MSDYDNDILLQMQRDGIRTTSGQHIGPRQTRRAPKWACGCCMDQGCDFCNEPTPDDELFATREEWREKPL